MTPEIIFVICLVLVAFILFISERFSIDVVALSLLSVLFFGGFLTIDEALAGFSNKDVIKIYLIFVLINDMNKNRII